MRALPNILIACSSKGHKQKLVCGPTRPPVKEFLRGATDCDLTHHVLMPRHQRLPWHQMSHKCSLSQWMNWFLVCKGHISGSLFLVKHVTKRSASLWRHSFLWLGTGDFDVTSGQYWWHSWWWSSSVLLSGWTCGTRLHLVCIHAPHLKHCSPPQTHCFCSCHTGWGFSTDTTYIMSLDRYCILVCMKCQSLSHHYSSQGLILRNLSNVPNL